MKPIVFRDALGNDWEPRVSLGTLRKFEAQTGASLFSKEVIDEMITGQRINKIVTLAYLACEYDAQKRGFSLDQFADNFHDDLQMRQMIEATAAAIQLFFRSRQSQETAKKS